MPSSPAHVATPYGFWADDRGVPGSHATIGAAHSVVHYGPDGWIDMILVQPGSSSGSSVTQYNIPFNPWAYSAPTGGTPTMPQGPIDPNTGLPVGTPPTPPPPVGDPTLPPGTPDPNSPPMGGTGFDVTCEFTGRVTGVAAPVQFEDVTLFRLPATGKVEVVVKRADVPKPNFFIGSLTDIGFTLKVVRKSDGQFRTYKRAEGVPVEALLHFN